MMHQRNLSSQLSHPGGLPPLPNSAVSIPMGPSGALPHVSPPSVLSLSASSLPSTSTSSPSLTVTTNDGSHRKQTFDIVGIIGFAAFSICLQGGYILSPKDRLFSLDDLSLAYPYIPEYPSVTGGGSHHGSTSVTVPRNTLWIYSILVPLLTILLTDGFIRRTSGNRTIQRLFYTFFGGISVVLVCSILQLASGTLTPDFRSRCIGDMDTFLNTTTITLTKERFMYSSQCPNTNNDPMILTYGRMSFPNLCASLTTYSMMITSIYIHNHIYIPNSLVWPIFFQGLPLALGLYASVSPYADYRAHGIDVFIGSCIGLLIGWCIQYKFLGRLKRSYYGEDPTEIAEFLLTHAKAVDDPEITTYLSHQLGRTSLNTTTTTSTTTGKKNTISNDSTTKSNYTGEQSTVLPSTIVALNGSTSGLYSVPHGKLPNIYNAIESNQRIESSGTPSNDNDNDNRNNYSSIANSSAISAEVDGLPQNIRLNRAPLNQRIVVR